MRRTRPTGRARRRLLVALGSLLCLTPTACTGPWEALASGAHAATARAVADPASTVDGSTSATTGAQATAGATSGTAPMTTTAHTSDPTATAGPTVTAVGHPAEATTSPASAGSPVTVPVPPSTAPAVVPSTAPSDTGVPTTDPVATSPVTAATPASPATTSAATTSAATSTDPTPVTAVPVTVTNDPNSPNSWGPAPPLTDTPPTPATDPADGSSTSAAARFGWGPPARDDEFTSGVGDAWALYDGPGQDGAGRRSPSAVTVADGVMTITGNAVGTTDGMAWLPGSKYGRWEARIRTPAGDPSYHAVALLWPDAENWPVGGEVDFMEDSDPLRQNTEMFLHYGKDNSQISSNVDIDATQWHDWAVEWTPDHITAYVDGVEWFHTTDTAKLPPGAMHLCLQLDWFPDRGGSVQQTTMSVDWARQYPL